MRLPGLSLCLILSSELLVATCRLHAAEVVPVPLNKNGTVLLDQQNQRLLLKGEVCLRQGVLEMFLCGKQTKEHESIVTLDAKASVIHAGLLALGMKPGQPVRFQPEYQAPQGQQLKIMVSWKDPAGKEHSRPAQEWVRYVTYRYFEAKLSQVPPGVVIDNTAEDGLRYDGMNQLLLYFGTMSKTKRDEFLAMSEDADYRAAVLKMYKEGQPVQMEASFVFAGSGISKLEDGSNYYQAEGGSYICVANFSDAMIDVAIKSSASDSAGRSFEPYTERIPKEGTPVSVEISRITPAEETSKE